MRPTHEIIILLTLLVIANIPSVLALRHLWRYIRQQKQHLEMVTGKPYSELKKLSGKGLGW